MQKIKLEKFEQEYREEISLLQGLSFQSVAKVPEFQAPAYSFLLKKAMSIAFAVPAFAMMFAFFFYSPNSTSTYNQDLAMLESSNARLMSEIESMDNVNN